MKTKKQKAWNKSSRANVKKRNQKFIDKYKSQGCVMCGYDDCLPALHLHHVIQKDPKLHGGFSLVAIPCWSLDRLKDEASKCVVLCANCHAEIHARMHDTYRLERKWLEELL